MVFVDDLHMNHRVGVCVDMAAELERDVCAVDHELAEDSAHDYEAELRTEQNVQQIGAGINRRESHRDRQRDEQPSSLRDLQTSATRSEQLPKQPRALRSRWCGGHRQGPSLGRHDDGRE